MNTATNHLASHPVEDVDQADAVAIKALAYLASDSDLLERFLALSGLQRDGMREAAGEPGFMVGLLDFFMQRYADAYRFELTTFCNMLSGENVAFPSGHDGLKALELADAAVQSLKTGSAVKPGA